MTDTAPPATARAEPAATLRLAAPLVGANLLRMAVLLVDRRRRREAPGLVRSV